MTPEPSAESAERLDYAELAQRNGDPATALAGVRAVLKADAPELSSEQSLRARIVLASALEGVGDYPAAIPELEALVAEAPRDLRWIVLVIALSRCYRESGDVPRAISVGERAALEISGAGLSGTEEAIRLEITVAGARIAQGDLRFALRMCGRAAERAEAIGSDVGRASAYWNASLAHFELGEMQVSIELAVEALRIFEVTGDARAQGTLHSNLALAHLRLHPPDVATAESHATQAVSLLEWSEASTVEQAKVQQSIATIAFLRGDNEEARRTAARCLTIAADRAPVLAAHCCLILGRVALAESGQEEARPHFDRAVLLLASVGQDWAIAEAWFQLGGLLQDVGDTEAAIDAFRRAAISNGLVSLEPLSTGG